MTVADESAVHRRDESAQIVLARHDGVQIETGGVDLRVRPVNVFFLIRNYCICSPLNIYHSSFALVSRPPKIGRIKFGNYTSRACKSGRCIWAS